MRLDAGLSSSAGPPPPPGTGGIAYHTEVRRICGSLPC
jgi:hypothetical protein